MTTERPLQLSPSMAATLEWLQQNDGWNAAPYANQTMNALQRRGLVVWCPYGKRDGMTGIWKLTKYGKKNNG